MFLITISFLFILSIPFLYSFYSLIGFLVLYSIIVISSLMVVLSKNPINSLFFLISTFLNSSILLILYKMDFLAFIFLIIYVGAIAVFFLFMIMMMNLQVIHNIKFTFISFFEYLILFLLITQFIYMSKNFLYFGLLKNEIQNFNNLLFNFNYYYVSSYHIIGEFFYSYYFELFLGLGFFLVIILIGVLLLIQENRLLFKYKKNNFSDLFYLYNQSILLIIK